MRVKLRDWTAAATFVSESFIVFHALPLVASRAMKRSRRTPSDYLIMDISRYNFI